MMDLYPAKYSDAQGTEDTVIYNDGEILRMTVCNVQFEGTDFDSFEPSSGAPQHELTRFSLNENQLCACCIQCTIPIEVHDSLNEAQGSLSVKVTLGSPDSRGGIEQEKIHLALQYDLGRFESSGESGWFEDELLEIQSQLPKKIFIRSCINCLYSDYNPYGHGAFGSMMCFRNLKSAYLKVKSKSDFWTLHDRYDRFVQETYVCSEFERRISGTGYRG